MKQRRTKGRALVLFGSGAVAAAAVCALVASLPDPRRDAVRSSGSSQPSADVSVTVSGRTVRIHNRGPDGTGPVSLDLRPSKGGELYASCDQTGCAWPDLPSGESVEVRLEGRGRGSAAVHTTVPDLSPEDNEVRLLLRR